MKITSTKNIQEVLERVDGIESTNLTTFKQEITSTTNRTVQCNGKELIMLASYSYLGLINHPEIVEAAKNAIDKYGTGAGGVRLLSGTTNLHVELENRIAKMKRKEAAILYSTGFMTNVSVISCLMEKEDLILIDKFDHQSIYDGCKLSEAKWMRFDHNDIDDLELKLKENVRNFGRILIVFDGVYSMDGDIAPAPEIVRLAKKYGVYTMVDEAHSIGVLGKNGKGIDEYFGLGPDDIDIYMGTLSKAIPSVGGYVACSKDLITFLQFHSHGFIFSAALPPSAIAAASKAFDIIDKDKERQYNLKKRIGQFLTGCKKIGLDTMMSKDSAVIPVLIGDEMKTVLFAKMMFDSGVFVCPIVYPAVARNSNRLRCCIMATHTEEDIEYILKNMEKISRELKIS